MKIVHEDLWKPAENTVYIVTTNATVRKNGGLVMGRGAALQATKKFPGIEYECGRLVGKNFWSTYGLLLVRPDFGIFQVKYHWSHMANLDLIKASSLSLEFNARTISHTNFRMNYPGIGNGRLERKDVEPLLINLPDNVTICIQ